MHYARALIATDLSDNSAQAARFGTRLVAPGGRLRLLHVLDQPASHEFMGSALRDRLSSMALEQNARAREGVEAWAKQQSLPPHDLRVVEGSSKRDIVAEAQEMQADLIVVGHHGRNALADKVLGSTAKAVLRHAPCDVLVVPERENVSHGSHLDRVVLATDFYGPSQQAGRRALQIAKGAGAELTALHVVDNDLWRAVGYERPVMGTGTPDEVWLETNVKEMLNEFNRKTLDGAAKEELRRGRPHQETARYAEESGADLVVVGTHGAGGIERALLGSVAENIVAGASRPVLVVKAENA